MNNLNTTSDKNQKMRVFSTIVNGEVDGFNFAYNGEVEKAKMKLRAIANKERGMFFLESEITEGQRIKILRLWKNRKYRDVARILMKTEVKE
jgi:hypothetical protein